MIGSDGDCYLNLYTLFYQEVYLGFLFSCRLWCDLWELMFYGESIEDYFVYRKQALLRGVSCHKCSSTLIKQDYRSEREQTTQYKGPMN